MGQAAPRPVGCPPRPSGGRPLGEGSLDSPIVERASQDPKIRDGLGLRQDLDDLDRGPGRPRVVPGKPEAGGSPAGDRPREG